MADGQAVTAAPKAGTPKLNEALKQIQAVMEAASKDSINPFFKSKDDPKKANGSPYADMTSCWAAWKAAKPESFGLSLTQEGYDCPKGFVGVRTCLLHDSGEERVSYLRLPCVAETPQSYGAAFTYARRYGFKAMVGMVDDDDDGNTASGVGLPPKTSPVAQPRSESGRASTFKEPQSSEAAPKAAPRPAQAAPGATRSGLPATFPNYGRAKGAPIAGASKQDLDFYANGARRSLEDPAKANFHAKEQALLEAIEAEIAGVTGGSQPHGADDEPPPHTDSDAF